MSLGTTVQQSAHAAAWGLAAASVERQIVQTGSATGDDAAALASRAQQHVVAAMRASEVVAGSSVTDAAVAARLVAERGVIGLDDPQSLSVAVNDAWAAQRALALAHGDPVLPAPRAWFASGDLADRSLVSTAEAARIARRTLVGPVVDMEHILAEGKRAGALQRLVTPQSFNRAVDLVPLLNPFNGTASIAAIRKGPRSQAAQEEFGYLLGVQLGVDHLLPATARRNSGNVYIQHLAGRPFWEARINDVAALDRALESDYRLAFPNLPRSEASRAAHVDRELLQVYDYVMANSDRHHGNGILADSTSTPYFIDAGFAGQGETSDALVPRLKSFFQGPAGHTALSATAVAELDARLGQAGQLEAVHRSLLAPAGMLDARSSAWLTHLRSDDYLARVRMRVEHSVERHGFDFRPIGNDEHAVEGLSAG